jgi:tetratricopeptide (TPR) repeat protein
MELETQLSKLEPTKEHSNIKDTSDLNKTLNLQKIASEPVKKVAQKQTVQQSSVNNSNTKLATVQAGIVKVSPETAKPSTLSKAPVNVAPEINTKPVSNPQLAECYYIRALQKYILQNRESALADFNMAIQYNPNYAEAYYYRAAIKRDMKDEGFVSDYKKAISLNPELKSVSDADVLTILKI